MKKILRAALLFTATVAGSVAVNGQGPDWPVYHGDAALSGVAWTTLPDKLSVLWRFNALSPVSLPPVVGGGMIFFVAGDGRAYAINLDGVQAWSAHVPSGEARAGGPNEEPEKFAAPPLYVRGLALAGSNKGNLYALDAARGKIKWKHKVGGNLKGTANWIEPEGGRGARVVAVSQPDGVAHCVDLSSGKLVWASKPTDRCDGSPAVGGGFVVFGNCASELQVLATDSGAKMAQIAFHERGPVAAGVAVAGNLVFAGTRDGSLVCADARKGSIVWTNRFAGSEAFTTPAVTADRVVCGSNDGVVYCLDRADGRQVWSFKCGDEPHSPVVAGDMVVVASGGTLSILKFADGSKIWSDKPGDLITSPAVAGGRIYIGTDEGFIICYGFAKE
jgi:outer membrane protein assembly factor BamB